MTVIRNVGRTADHVKLILKDGTIAFGRVMSRNKGVKIPEGAKVCPAWAAQFGEFIKVFEETAVPTWSTAADNLSSKTPQA